METEPSEEFAELVALIHMANRGFQVVHVAGGQYLIKNRTGRRVASLRDEFDWWNSPHKPE
jgi:hypothetical protein